MAATNIKSLYERRAQKRSQFLQRARHNALLTMPSLLPLEGQTETAHLIEPYQGLGSMGVSHLSSRITVALIPAGRPYMRLDLPPEVKVQQDVDDNVEIQKNLAKVESIIQGEVEAKRWRGTTLQTVQQLMVAGNAVEYMQPDNTIRVYRLDQFTVRRDHLGRVMELILMEKFLKDEVTGLRDEDDISSGSTRDEEEVELYTMIRMETDGDKEWYERTQEWGDGTDVGVMQAWPIDKLPYLVLRWNATPGEDYGRSLIEEHAADLRSLEGLDKAGLEMAGMGSRNFIMVRPGAMASSMKNRLVRAINGDVIVGDPDAVELKSFTNVEGYEITERGADTVRQSLARAFLLTGAGQRDAERVTAFEIQRDIEEIEASKGGVFSTLAQDIMERRTAILMDQMKRQKRLPEFPDNAVVPIILTGLEALSRERDVSRAAQAAEIAQMFGEGAKHVVKTDVILGRAFIGLGFPGAVNTPEETQQLREQDARLAQEEAMVKAGAGPAAKALAQEGDQ